MPTHELAGQPAPPSILVNPNSLEKDYYEKKPDPSNPTQCVAFGTSGHRGKSADASFNEAHILAICQAVVDYRTMKGYSGPLYLGKDTHFLSGPAQRTALEVFTANDVEVVYETNDGFTPTPVISHAILRFNKGKKAGLADGVVITPSHNPPSDGGIKYNAPNGGPADTDITGWIQDKANDYLRADLNGVKRTAAVAPSSFSFLPEYVADLKNVVGLKAIAKAKIRIGVDPLGGAGIGYWEPIAEKYGLDITVVNKAVDPTFAFMSVDHDGKIRMDCSSPYAMRGLVALKDKFDIAFANDPDTDRHGIVAPSIGLMNPNHYLAVAIEYLFGYRPYIRWKKSLCCFSFSVKCDWGNRSRWPSEAAIGKTLVSSGIIDRVAENLKIKVVEVPVGFKWFVDGLHSGALGFGGEESAGASFLRFNGDVWSTDKDGIIMNLLAAEILAVTKTDPGLRYQDLERRFGSPAYIRVDQAATPEQKAAFQNLTPEKVTATELAGAPIIQRLTNAPGNGASIGGLKVVSAHGWFAARPSGTENIYKIYAESFKGPEHLDHILDEAHRIVGAALS